MELLRVDFDAPEACPQCGQRCAGIRAVRGIDQSGALVALGPCGCEVVLPPKGQKL